MREDALVGRVAQKKKKTAKRRESGTCSEPRRWLVTTPALPQVTCAHHRASPARLKALFTRAGLAPGNGLEVTSLPSLPTLISLQSSSDACSSLSSAGLVFRLRQGDSLSFTGSSSSQMFLPVTWIVPFCSGVVFGDGFLRLRSDGSRCAFENLGFVLLLLLPSIGSGICPLKASTHFWASFLEILVK